MRLTLGVLAYLCGVVALVSAVVAGFQVMMGPANSGAAYATASSTTVPASVPAPRSEPKRVEAIRPINEPVQTPTPKYEASSVPVSETAAYNKKKAQQHGQHSAQRKHTTPKLSNEAANAYGSGSFGWGQGSAPQPRRPRDTSIY